MPPKYPLPNTPILATSEQLSFNVFFNLIEIKLPHHNPIDLLTQLPNHFLLTLQTQLQQQLPYAISFYLPFSLPYSLCNRINHFVNHFVHTKSYSFLRTVLCMILYVFKVHTPHIPNPLYTLENTPWRGSGRSLFNLSEVKFRSSRCISC